MGSELIHRSKAYHFQSKQNVMKMVCAVRLIAAAKIKRDMKMNALIYSLFSRNRVNTFDTLKSEQWKIV